MISHKHKCIFIHIPRTAGTSIEKWIHGSNWWDIKPETKHLTASQAKEIYNEFWDDYFKFTFIRNPWDRVISCLKFSEYFGIYHHKKSKLHLWKNLDLNKYKKRFGSKITLEYDYRFHKQEDLISKKHLPGQVYQNILDEELDFIGQFENLAADCKKIQNILGLEKEFSEHAVSSKKRRKYQYYYNKKSIREVQDLYQKDIEHFDYKY